VIIENIVKKAHEYTHPNTNTEINKMSAEIEDLKHESKGLSSKENDVDGVSVVASNMNSTKQIEWSPENEVIMVEWCDVAQCYKWLHSRAHEKYASRNAWYTIPAIVLSTISGTASFAQTSLPVQYQGFAPMVIGSINILVGILTTVQQYLKISELNEAHRVASISWDKFARNIRIELAKKPDERMDAGHFLKINRQEYDRLMETSPNIKEEIIKEFERTFKGKEGTIERKRFDELKKPDICSVIITANETRHHWYLDKPAENFADSMDRQDIRRKDETILIQNKKLKDAENLLRKQKLADAEKMKRMQRQSEDYEEHYNDACEKINEYVSDFSNLYGRNPIKDEIEQQLKETVDTEYLSRYFAENV